MKCFFCKSNKDLLIKKYEYWTVLVHSYDRSHVGRCMVKLNRHIEDFLDTNKRERNELFKVLEKLKKAASGLFEPDLFNYASLGNEIRHLHIHFIPRYRRKRIFAGIEFMDNRWGYIYLPYNKRKIPKTTLNELKKQISQELK